MGTYSCSREAFTTDTLESCPTQTSLSPVAEKLTSWTQPPGEGREKHGTRLKTLWHHNPIPHTLSDPGVAFSQDSPCANNCIQWLPSLYNHSSTKNNVSKCYCQLQCSLYIYVSSPADTNNFFYDQYAKISYF